MNFDYEVQKFLDEYYPMVRVEGFLKASKTNMSLWKEMKKRVKEAIITNNKGYGLNIDMVKFEAYFNKVRQIVLSVFNTSDGRIVIYDNTKGYFVIIKKDKSE